MAVETNRQRYYPMEDVNPEWWGKWLKKPEKTKESIIKKK